MKKKKIGNKKEKWNNKNTQERKNRGMKKLRNKKYEGMKKKKLGNKKEKCGNKKGHRNEKTEEWKNRRMKKQRNEPNQNTKCFLPLQNFNERTNTLLYKNIISPTLFLKGWCWLCVRDELETGTDCYLTQVLLWP